ncbi:MAG: sigma-70 family RNA polymerase sigma factor [Verrucomicrobiae bacterium]|nr:sigma-70 family RNA polymerase sigma factor [Verrucomicrobiae bacterium]
MERMNMDDWELLRAYVGGSEAAFADLVRRHVDHVYSTALRRVNDPVAAQDVAQRVFCLLARKASALDPSGSLVGWLHRSAVHLSRESLRADRRRRDREAAAWQLHLMPRESAPSSGASDAVWQQVAPELDAALLELPEPDRLAVLLRFFQQLPLREVGARLGVSEAAAKMRIGRAILKLRRGLGARGIALSAGALAWLLSDRAVAAAPAGCAGTVISAVTAATSAVSPWAALLALVARIPFPVAVGVAALLVATGGFLIATQSHPWSRVRGAGDLPFSELSESNAVAMDADALEAAAVVAAPADPLDDPIALRLAVENLRSVLREPRGRRMPVDRIAEAIRRLGRHGDAAVPMIFEELRATVRPMNSAVEVRELMGIRSLSAEALRQLGPAAREAVPEVLALLKDGTLAALNDAVAKLIPALDPSPDQIQSLVSLVATSDIPGIHWAGQAVISLLEQRPEAREAALETLQSALDSGSGQQRLRIAGMLAQIPGNDPVLLRPIFEESLRLSALRDPEYSLPVTGDHGPVQQRYFDDLDRIQAVRGLAQLGEASRDSLPALEELASRATLALLREETLRAIGSVDPEQRFRTPEVAAVWDAWEADQAFSEHESLANLTAEDLRSGLRSQRTVNAAASHIAALGENGKAFVPDLMEALRQSGSFEAAQALKQLAPERLVTYLQDPAAFTLEERMALSAEPNPAQQAFIEAAQALGELGPAAAFALPALREALELPDKARLRLTIDETIRKIDPNAPVSVFRGDAITPINQALILARDAAERDGQPDRARLADETAMRMELNHGMTRRELLGIGAELQASDPELYAAYAQSLWQANPALRAGP